MKVNAFIILGTIYVSVENVKISQFTANVYKEIAKSNSNSFLVCPLSVKLVLAMLQVGAGGRTSKQIAQALDLPNNFEALSKFIHRMNANLKSTEQYELETANKIYIRNGYKIKKRYRKTIINIFKAGIQKIDFDNTRRAADKVNKWVERHTNKKIKNLVGPEHFDGSVILINAMYFRGTWVRKFNKTRTTMDVFYRTPDDEIEVEMMKIKSPFNYYRSVELSAKFLEMPYEGKDVTMTLVLPDEPEGLDDLEAQIATVFLPLKYRYRHVIVEVPKIKLESKIDFTEILKELGVTDAFDFNANFSGISRSVVPINSVIQKTFMEVDEEGTSAAAATVGSMQRSGLMPLNFKANRPFIFFLKCKIGIFFVGRYTGPD